MLRHPQLQAQQLEQVCGLVTALIELLPSLSESSGIDQSSDSAELWRQRQGNCWAGLAV
jgi:hypothetical protein